MITERAVGKADDEVVPTEQLADAAAAAPEAWDPNGASVGYVAL